MNSKVNPEPYADWTSYMPENTAYSVHDLLKWQPLLETTGRGYFTSQQHITPHVGQVSGDNTEGGAYLMRGFSLGSMNPKLGQH